jgi:O-antigen biosynthesis protein WbqP|tara:strand:- start:815 stop:1375 length:561 start_codon:yes stop_codon:yes gene_type:complete
MKRMFDCVLATTLAIVLLVPMILFGIAIKFNSKGPIFFVSDRVGQGNHLFKMIKFRSMKIGTPIVSTDLLDEPKRFLTSIGSFLRRTSVDELPQIWNILCGDMSFVGPRPALFNQVDLIKLRTEKSIDSMLPGLTGWAQVNGRDELTIDDKVSLDHEYMLKQSFNFDLKILWLTYLKVIRKESISH